MDDPRVWVSRMRSGDDRPVESCRDGLLVSILAMLSLVFIFLFFFDSFCEIYSCLEILQKKLQFF
jgi:hypothetical protein